MELLDLPPELFQKITHDLVEVAGIRNAWRLRIDARFLGKCGDRYLECRLQSPLDVDQDLLNKIQNLIDWTTQAVDTAGIDERRSVAQKICTALKDRIGAWNLIDDLGRSGESGKRRRWTDWSKAELDDHDKALSALATGSYALLLKIFSDSKALLGPPWFEFIPFEIALATGDQTLFETILSHLKSLPLDARIVQTHLRRVGRDFYFNTKHAVQNAIYRHRGDALQSLLDFYEQHLPRPEKATFDSWFADAANEWNVEEQLPRLMDFKPGGKTMLARHHFRVVCDAGNAAMIGDVLTRLGTDPNNGGILSLPIFVAVRSGRETAIKAVIDAGADPNITAPSHIPSLSIGRVSPMDVAIHKHISAAISALVTYGNVALPHISEWPTHERTYLHLRSIVRKSLRGNLPGIRDFKCMNDSERKAIKY
ncbi:hypothetical protein BKA63DRAFT_535683 [Paraphoma chrysanthemicola]|nr:hypothetical protein BKA63DRAFT_535683 [Paraphoma chrysanthemicola]